MPKASANPKRYVALLRAINLGARNRVPMGRLRELCEEAGATEVRTYIASGNVVLTSSLSAAAIRTELQRTIESEFGISTAVVMLTARQLAAVVKNNPFPGAQPNSLHVAFAAGPIPQPDIERLQKLDIQPEEIGVRGSQIYMHMPNGYGRSALAAEVSRVKVPTTVRNWRTVGTLNELAANSDTIRS